MLPVLRKYPEEARTISFDFEAKVVPVSDSLTGTPTFASSPGVTLSGGTRNGNVASVRVAAGIAGNSYTVWCICGTVNGDTLKLAATLEVSTDAN